MFVDNKCTCVSLYYMYNITVVIFHEILVISIIVFIETVALYFYCT